MADITVTAAQVSPVYPQKAVIYPAVAGTAITAGAICYFDTNGKLALSDASATATAKVHGMALNSAGANQAVSLLVEGFVAGFNVSNLAYNDILYLSNTDTGIVGDVAGSTSKVLGRVLPMSDSSATKMFYFRATDWP